ncbi:hypothetical protein CSV74_16200 [Sporosarcina sp. P19]|nr:hypothetical protein CSV74_16200 [Sporosarcina sp. P19]
MDGTMTYVPSAWNIALVIGNYLGRGFNRANKLTDWVQYPTKRRVWWNDYAAAGLCYFLLGTWLDWLLGTEVSECLLSGPA